MEYLKNWKDKVANKATDVTSIVPDLSQLDKYNIIKRLGILEDRLNNTSDQLMKDLTYVQMSAQNLASTIAAGTLEISTSVQNIAKVLGATSMDIATSAASLGTEFLNSATRINNPASYIKEQMESMANDVSDMRGDIRRGISKYWDALQHAASAINNAKDGLSVMTYSGDHGGPLFVQLTTSFNKISGAAFQLKRSYDNFAGQNKSTISKEADDIQKAANGIVAAINKFSKSFTNIFTNLANNIKGLTKQ